MIMAVSQKAFFIILFSIISTAFAHNGLHSRAGYAIKESHHVPRDWKAVGIPPPDHTIALNIALKQSRFDELERQLYEVSDPKHTRYGLHLTQEEVHELIKPDEETWDLVHTWLADHGITKDLLDYSPAKDWINIRLPLDVVEYLLDTKYKIYEHKIDGTQLVRTTDWSLPIHLHDHIELIAPTNSFFRAQPKSIGIIPIEEEEEGYINTVPIVAPIDTSTDVNISSICSNTNVTPLCLRTLYQTINYTTQAKGKNLVGLCNYLGESSNRSDAKLFLQTYRPEASKSAYKFIVTSVNGGIDMQSQEPPDKLDEYTDLEGNLDAQTILGISWPTPLIVYSTGGSPPFKPSNSTPTNSNEPYLAWVNYFLSQSDKDIAKVVSTSYDDDEQAVPPSFAKTVCNRFAQAGARGVSLFFASGDGGVGGNGTCISNDGENRRMFTPLFPSTCPYITSVGATTNFEPEVVARDVSRRTGKVTFSSGGGFSNYFQRPSYQNDAVATYLSNIGKLYKNLYNSSGRAYPDISANGQRYVIAWNGTFIHVDGTSASTPTVSAIFALVNDALLNKKRPTMGFLNPWLYQQGYMAMNDITSGSAIGCGVAGFPAVGGWDPVTGWGTPRFMEILTLLGL